MPYFKWIGIDLLGNIHKGKQFARTFEILDKNLLFKEIGLIKAKQLKSLFSYVSVKTRNNTIYQLSILLSASVRISQALTIVSAKIKNKHFKAILDDISLAVYEGISLYDALTYHDLYFDELTRAIVGAGEKSGNLANAFEQLAYHNEVIFNFKKNIQSALIIPFFTFGFFILVMLSIFIFVIPKFESFFSSIKEPLPDITRLIFLISNAIRSFSIIYLMISILVFVLISRFILKRNLTKKYKDKIILNLPIIGNFNRLSYNAHFLHIMSILSNSGVQLSESLIIAYKSINNLTVKMAVQDLLNGIYNGEFLHSALNKNFFFASAELEALIEIGHSSGNLGPLFKHASSIYQKKVYEIINNIVTMIQPFLLIVLGLFIAILIFAVYMPIFTLSTIVK